MYCTFHGIVFHWGTFALHSPCSGLIIETGCKSEQSWMFLKILSFSLSVSILSRKECQKETSLPANEKGGTTRKSFAGKRECCLIGTRKLQSGFYVRMGVTANCFMSKLNAVKSGHGSCRTNKVKQCVFAVYNRNAQHSSWTSFNFVIPWEWTEGRNSRAQ